MSWFKKLASNFKSSAIPNDSLFGKQMGFQEDRPNHPEFIEFDDYYRDSKLADIYSKDNFLGECEALEYNHELPIGACSAVQISVANGNHYATTASKIRSLGYSIEPYIDFDKRSQLSYFLDYTKNGLNPTSQYVRNILIHILPSEGMEYLAYINNLTDSFISEMSSDAEKDFDMSRFALQCTRFGYNPWYFIELLPVRDSHFVSFDCYIPLLLHVYKNTGTLLSDDYLNHLIDTELRLLEHPAVNPPPEQMYRDVTNDDLLPYMIMIATYETYYQHDPIIRQIFLGTSKSKYHLHTALACYEVMKHIHKWDDETVIYYSTLIADAVYQSYTASRLPCTLYHHPELITPDLANMSSKEINELFDTYGKLSEPDGDYLFKLHRVGC